MKESDYILVRNLGRAEHAKRILREMDIYEDDGPDWTERANAIRWLMNLCTRYYSQLGDMDES